MTQISRRGFLKGAAVAGAGLVLAPHASRAGLDPAPSGGVWLPGDLHCHTIFSHDVYGGPTDDNTQPKDAYTLGWTVAEQIVNAESRGLQFLAITDHNDIRALADPLYTSSLLTLLPGYEHSLSKGHAGCLFPSIGAVEVSSIDTGSNDGASALADWVRRRGGVFVLNHPFYGDGWGYWPSVRPDSVEVWNIAWPYRHIEDTGQPDAVAVSDDYKSLPYWEAAFLSTGRMPASGGSDNHWRSTQAVQGVGQPTTWVYAKDASVESILEGIKAGRTSVSAEPPALGGVRLELTACAGSRTWMIGDEVPADAGAVRVTARAVGQPASTVAFVVDGVAQPGRLAGPATYELVVDDPSAVHHVRAEAYLDEGYWMGAFTSPIYMGSPPKGPDPGDLTGS